MILFHRLLDTPVGTLRLVGSGAGLVEIGLPGAEGMPSPRDDHALAQAARQLEAWFAGERTTFDLPLAPTGTPFQKAVWGALVGIPFGETRTYGQLATELGRPGSARAVGAANGANPLPIVVPCHRVIGADGSLTGYSGGLELKRRLLELEHRRAPGALPLG